MRRKAVLLLAVCMLTGCTQAEQPATTATVTEIQEEVQVDTEVSADVTENAEQKEEEVEEQSKDSYMQARVRDYYGKILWDLQYSSKTPEDESGTYSESDETSLSNYSIFDVDCDGVEELLFYTYGEDSMFGVGYLYKFDTENSTLVTELIEEPFFTFYSNGILKVSLENGRTLANDFPYCIYEYNLESKIYEMKGRVDTWDKNVVDVDYDNNPFPDERDTDGDGVIYYITDVLGNGYDAPKTKEECDAWLQSYIGDASEVSIDWQDVKEENYGGYADENINLFKERYNSQNADSTTDIGTLFINSDDDKEALNQIDSMLGDTYGVQMDRQMIGDSLYQVNGTLDGEAVYGSYRDGAGFLSYSGKQIGDVTVCGIYPGMSEEEAKQKLEASGFYWDTYNYVSGELDNNYYVTLYLENGTVQSIQFGLTINW